MVLASVLLAASAAAASNVAAVPAAGPYFALTFDAHVEAQGAREMLTLLRERRVRATLFVTGRFAQAYPAIVRQAAEDGHEIGNHTFDHPHLTTWETNRRHATRPGVTRGLVLAELRRTAVAIEAAIGRPQAPYWRAPYGEQNSEIRAWAGELGLLHVDWTRAPGDSLDALDWIDSPHARGFMGPEAMARRVLNFERKNGVPLAGGIILMHLGSARPDLPLLEALPIILDETDRRGLKPLSVSELLRRGDLSAMTSGGSGLAGDH